MNLNRPSSLLVSDMQWSSCGDYLLCVDDKQSQIVVLRLGGQEASPTLQEVARLSNSSSAFFCLICESTLTCWCVVERDDELLVACSMSCKWLGFPTCTTCALWTLPITQLTPSGNSALDSIRRLWRGPEGRVTSLSQYIENALGNLVHESLNEISSVCLSPDGRQLVVFANARLVLLVDLSLLDNGNGNAAAAADAIKIVRNFQTEAQGRELLMLFNWSPDGALLAIGCNRITEESIESGNFQLLHRDQLLHLLPEALQTPRVHSSGESGVLCLLFSSFCQRHLHMLFALRSNGDCQLYRIRSDCNASGQSTGACGNALHEPNAELLLRIQQHDPLGNIVNVAEDRWSARLLLHVSRPEVLEGPELRITSSVLSVPFDVPDWWHEESPVEPLVLRVDPSDQNCSLLAFPNAHEVIGPYPYKVCLCLNFSSDS